MVCNNVRRKLNISVVNIHVDVRCPRVELSNEIESEFILLHVIRSRECYAEVVASKHKLK